MVSVKIYSTERCPFCTMAKEWFNANNIKFTEINVEDDQEKAQEMIEKSGQVGVPVIIIEKDGKEEIIVGFNQDRLAELLDVKE